MKMIHVNPNVCMMWCDRRNTGEQEIKFNSKVDVVSGDKLSVGSKEFPVHYEINKIIEIRNSTLNSYKYITALAVRK